MVFTSSVFLLLFLPLFLGIYHLIPPSRRTAWMLVASYLFYGWWRLDFLALFVATTVFTYLVGRSLTLANEHQPVRARALLTLGVLGNLGTLAYFKYFNFGIESLDNLLIALGGSGLGAWQVLLPIGISFYVFQSVSYLVDSHRGDVTGDQRFVDVAAYIALFPQLIAGPIVRFKVLGPQLGQPRADFADFSAGSQRFMIGFCKKVLVADMVAPLADAAFALDQPTLAEAWLGALAFGIQLFFDFSGYSDMAIGLARMMGLKLLENFAMPYRSRTITEFWLRWHVSLSRWLRDYLYIPIGGNRRGRRRTYLNLALVMLLGGLWHGAAWTFVAWGAWHGLLLIGERVLRERGVLRRIPAPLAVARTFLFVTIGWVTFRADGFAPAVAMYRGLTGLAGVPLTPELAWRIPLSAVAALVAGCLIAWFAPGRDVLSGSATTSGGVGATDSPTPAPSHAAAHAPNPVAARAGTPAAAHAAGSRAAINLFTLGLIPIFLLGVLRTVADSFSPFLYFQF
ncbi:MAG: MBOAT family protein [Trueperaceae bacterium]